MREKKGRGGRGANEKDRVRKPDSTHTHTNTHSPTHIFQASSCLQPPVAAAAAPDQSGLSPVIRNWKCAALRQGPNVDSPKQTHHTGTARELDKLKFSSLVLISQGLNLAIDSLFR